MQRVKWIEKRLLKRGDRITEGTVIRGEMDGKKVA